MKKILLFGIVATLLTIGASAQDRRGDFRKHYSDRDFKAFHHNRGKDFTRGERHEMRQDAKSYHRAKQKALRDGKLSRREKAKLYKMKKHNRHQASRYKHNGRRAS